MAVKRKKLGIQKLALHDFLRSTEARSPALSFRAAAANWKADDSSS